MQKPHILVLLRVRSASSAPCKMPSGQALPFQRNILCNKTKGTQETNQVESFSMEPKCKTLTATVKDLHNHLSKMCHGVSFLLRDNIFIHLVFKLSTFLKRCIHSSCQKISKVHGSCCYSFPLT